MECTIHDKVDLFGIFCDTTMHRKHWSIYTILCERGLTIEKIRQYIEKIRSLNSVFFSIDHGYLLINNRAIDKYIICPCSFSMDHDYKVLYNCAMDILHSDSVM